MSADTAAHGCYPANQYNEPVPHNIGSAQHSPDRAAVLLCTHLLQHLRWQRGSAMPLDQLQQLAVHCGGGDDQHSRACRRGQGGEESSTWVSAGFRGKPCSI